MRIDRSWVGGQHLFDGMVHRAGGRQTVATRTPTSKRVASIDDAWNAKQKNRITILMSFPRIKVVLLTLADPYWFTPRNDRFLFTTCTHFSRSLKIELFLGHKRYIQFGFIDARRKVAANSVGLTGCEEINHTFLTMCPTSNDARLPVSMKHHVVV
jgi:hypothetical protein